MMRDLHAPRAVAPLPTTPLSVIIFAPQLLAKAIIAIIGLLAAILLSALSRARLATDNVVCKSNLRQYVLALNWYAGDFRCYPPCYLAEPGSPNAGGVINWY